jgi:hypothetical protein
LLQATIDIIIATRPTAIENVVATFADTGSRALDLSVIS